MKVIELLEDDNNYYVISEYLNGGTLIDRFKYMALYKQGFTEK